MSFQAFKAAHLKSGALAVDMNAAKTTAEMAQMLSKQMQAEGREEKDFNIEKCLEVKAALLETKANEIMHTTNTGYGAELIPGAVLTTDFLDMAPKQSTLLSIFQAGFHGSNLSNIEEVPVIGELPLHQLDSEQTTGAWAVAQGVGRLPTAKVTITQKQRFFTVDISEKEARFSVIDLLAIIKQKLAASAANTIVSDILNGHTDATINTNINKIDGTPAGTESYLAADGLRQTAFAASLATDAGTFEFADYLTLLKQLGNNATNRDDVTFIHSNYAQIAALGMTEFKQQYINGSVSTALTGKLPQFLGANVVTERWLRESNANGKISVTASNNTKGTVIAVNKYAVQWGTNGQYNIELYRLPGKGYQVIGWYWAGHAIANSLAGQDPTVAMLYNVA